MKVKTSELIGPALNWAVAKCEGLNPNTDPEVRKQYFGYPGFAEYSGFGYAIKNYSTDWSHAGPIIEREKIATSPTPDGMWAAYAPNGTRWVPRSQSSVETYNWDHKQVGPTLLIAAMRCYVGSKFGEFVEIPDELTH